MPDLQVNQARIGFAFASRGDSGTISETEREFLSFIDSVAGLIWSGAPGTGTNPEQLFAAGWSTCFIGAIKRVARQRKVALPADVAVDAEVNLGVKNDGHMGLSARLKVNLPGVDRQVAQGLLDEAHQTCPYSRATHGNIEAVITLV
jgi:lipoyl-dependent peroxiredoxin